MSSIVKTLEIKLFPIFVRFAERSNEMPNVRANVYSHSAGSLTEYPGHTIGIDCLLLKPVTDADNVALSVNLAYLTTRPRISADVCWGHPSGHIDAERGWNYGDSSTQGNTVTDEVLEDLYSNMPRLCEGLIDSVKRGLPSSESVDFVPFD